jgi:transmembrane sensor
LDQQTIYELLQKYKLGTATDEEIEALTKAYRLKAYGEEADPVMEFPEEEAAAEKFIFDRLVRETLPQRKTGGVKRFAIAASVLVLMSVGTMFLLKNRDGQSPKNLATKVSDVSPGGNKAILILADGSKVPLTASDKGKIANQGGIGITKTASGQVVYTISAPGPVAGSTQTDGSPIYNTIETPVGGQFQIVLADGTKVWLNAMSSLKFPVAFSGGNSRSVELKGEAYFEVTHNKHKPFRVNTLNQTVDVLGTHFNVSAYADEPNIKTTLLEGSVWLVAGKKNVLLKPGEQATLHNDFRVAAVNTEDVVAWKNGYFSFDDERLETIMKAVSKWYGVKVVFDDENLKDVRLGLVSARFSNLSSLLKIIQQTSNSDFRIEGSTVHFSEKK